MVESALPPLRRRTRSLYVALAVVALALAVGLRLSTGDHWKTRIGATADVIEMSSGLVFKARVDTGAALSSIHCVRIEIEDASTDPEQNVGKPARVLLANERDDEHWIEARIVDYARIQNVDAARARYFVRLNLQCQGIKKPALVTLDDRGHMSHRLLLGRDFLVDDFVVDVGMDNVDFR
jgi:hypothetical protein